MKEMNCLYFTVKWLEDERKVSNPFNKFQSILSKKSAEGSLKKFTELCNATPTSETNLKPPFDLHVTGSEHGPFSLLEVRALPKSEVLGLNLYLVQGLAVLGSHLRDSSICPSAMSEFQHDKKN